MKNCVPNSKCVPHPLPINSAYLLKDRKVNPTEKWTKELPYKARKLEEQLFKSSPSLEAYLDKSTLKHRLKKVAHAITSQFRLSKDGKKKTSSTTSRRSDPVTSDITSSMISPDLNLPAASFCSLSASGVDPEISQKLLQEQILENIRQQQIIMKSLMMAQNQQQGGPLSNTPIMDSQNSMMAGFEQRMHGGQANNANVGGVENMLLQQAQMGFGGASRNMSPMGNSWSSQQLAIMNNMGFEAPSGMGNLGPGLTGGMQGLIGMNSMNGLDPNQLYQNQFMLRNSNIGGSVNPATTMAMNQANMEGSVIPGPSMSSGMNTGVHPTMPPPAFGVSGRSSFTNGSLNTNGGISEDNLSLSPNSFNW